ncbi:MAG: phosphatidylinositol-specific phospholipase C1-like protein [Chryseolinea sp.]
MTLQQLTANLVKSAQLLTIVICFAFSPAKNRPLKLNEIQVIGSHNSYKQTIEKPLMELILAKDTSNIGLDYHHLPIKDQLSLGLRGLEIDVLHDPEGKKYKNPVGLKLLRSKGIIPLPYDERDELSKKGMKVLHVPDIDFRSHCLTFVGCLMEIKEWSDANPDHLPIIITINPKDSGIELPGFTSVFPFTSNVLDSLDKEILSVFPPSRLVTPDLVKGKSATLREAVTTKGWPLLKSVRGKMLFVLDAEAGVTNLYIKTSLKSKPMFPNVPVDKPEAAFLIMNEPATQHDKIREFVKLGFMVRTRADSETREARRNDYSRLKQAISSGAQLISTDYYDASLSPSGNFEISYGDNSFAHCNPLIAPEHCHL